MAIEQWKSYIYSFKSTLSLVYALRTNGKVSRTKFLWNFKPKLVKNRLYHLSESFWRHFFPESDLSTYLNWQNMLSTCERGQSFFSNFSEDVLYKNLFKTFTLYWILMEMYYWLSYSIYWLNFQTFKTYWIDFKAEIFQCDFNCKIIVRTCVLLP